MPTWGSMNFTGGAHFGAASSFLRREATCVQSQVGGCHCPSCCPRSLGDRRMGQHPASAFFASKQSSLTFNGGQVQFLAAQPDTLVPRRQVHPEGPRSERPTPCPPQRASAPAGTGDWLRSPSAAPPPRRAWSGKSVCAGVQRLDLVCILTAGASGTRMGSCDQARKPGGSPPPRRYPADPGPAA